MNLRTADFLMTRFASTAPGLLKMLGEMESDSLRARLEPVTLDRPVFISGLARSGTTILLNLCSELPEVGTHRYRDFPFLFMPYWWNQFQRRMARDEAPVERPHKDRIVITKDSPEAFEEPLWMHFFPHVHQPDASHLLTAADADPDFDAFYLEHLRKILLVRGATRYVSKGNYNIARIEYLARLLPDARFIIPVRHPLTHVHSLVRQHELFVKYSAEDARIPLYMRAAGHYEFGPQRVPINLDERAQRRTLDAWTSGDDALGYSIMWNTVYSHAKRLADGPLGARISLVRYEDFCADPAGTLRRLFDACGLAAGTDALLAKLPPISPPELRPAGSADEAVWRETGGLAQALGYGREP